jgi:anti-sigma factor RsiW
MSHPDALLAEYVDGALAEGERAVVERHLDACERCREEVSFARAARSALASVAEAPAPGNLGDAAIAEARRRAAGAPAAAAPSGKPGWYRWAGAAAGIAAALLLLTLVLPHIGREPAREAAGGAAAQGAAASPATTVEAQNVDYDLAGVEALATSYRGGADGTFAPNERGTKAPEATGVTTAQRIPFADAVACLDRAFTPATGSQGLPGQLVRVIQARFRGTPAILGVYLIGPGAGQPTDIVRVLVASSRGCSILTSTQATT